MKVLITGAGGLVGRRLVDRLLERGHEIVVLSRDPDDVLLDLPVRCDVHGWDPSSGSIDTTCFAGVDGVVHLAGANVGDARWTPERKSLILDSRVASSRLLVNTINDLPADDSPSVFVAASAIGFYGDRGDEPLDEEAAPGQGFLPEVCLEWESESAGADAIGVRTVLLRTGIVLAREGGALAKMLLPFRLLAGGRLGSGRQWMSWIHIDDLVSLYVYALEEEKLEGPVNAVAPTPVTNRDFTKALAHALGRPALIPAPAFALRAALGERADLLLQSQRVHPVVARESGFEFDYQTLELALEDLCSDFTSEFRQEIWLDESPEDIFPFFSDPANLGALTPAFCHFRILSGAGVPLQEGALVDYRLRLHGIPLRWRARVDIWDPPRSFVDTQLRGPFKMWSHTHEFEAFDGGTIVRDRVRLKMPLGVLGDLLVGPLVRRDINTVLAYRRAAIFDQFLEPQTSSIWSAAEGS
jgi:uncharacterized protein (TIGR01777 family)